MNNSLMVHDLDRILIILGKNYIRKRNPDDFILDSVVIPNFKIALTEFFIPLYTAKQFMDRDHCSWSGIEYVAPFSWLSI